MKRIITAAVAIPLVLLITIYSPDWLFAAAVGVVAVAAVEEFLSLAGKKGIGRPGAWFSAMAGLIPLTFLNGAEWTLFGLTAAVLLLMSATIFTEPIETALGRVGMGLGAMAYCAITLGFLVLMPREVIPVLFAIIWIGDTAAYYGGRALGRHPLTKVSPKKTVEGAIFGLLGSVIAGVALGVWLLGEPWMFLAVVSAATAIAGQLGDLAESVLKRSVGVKDSSSILPGHGGILDRLDSLFFAAPVFYWLFNA